MTALIVVVHSEDLLHDHHPPRGFARSAWPCTRRGGIRPRVVNVSISPMVLLPSLSICANRPSTLQLPKLDGSAGFVKEACGGQHFQDAALKRAFSSGFGRSIALPCPVAEEERSTAYPLPWAVTSRGKSSPALSLGGVWRFVAPYLCEECLYEQAKLFHHQATPGAEPTDKLIPDRKETYQ